MRLFAIAALGISFLLAGCSTFKTDDYEIKLHRPAKVGDAYTLNGNGGMLTSSFVINGEKEEKANDTSDTKVELRGKVKVLAVGKDGRVARETLVLETFVVSTNGEKREPLAKGSILTVYANGSLTVFELEGKPLNEELSSLLSLAHALDGVGPNDDEIFGVSEKKKVGDSWAINTDAFALCMKKDDIQIDKAATEGKVTALKLETAKNGLECLSVAAEITAKNVKIGEQMPEGVKVEKTEMAISVSNLMPLKSEKRIAENLLSMKMLLIVSANAGNGEQKVKTEVSAYTKTVIEE